jgi:hypothetical protein
MLESTAVFCLYRIDFHQPGNTVLATPDALFPENLGYSRTPVSPPAVLEYLPDLSKENIVGLFQFRSASMMPGIKATPVDLERLAHLLYSKFGAV